MIHSPVIDPSRMWAVFIVFFLLFTMAGPDSAEADPRRCLNKAQQRAAVASGLAIKFSAAVQAAKRLFRGDVIRARLCHHDGGMVYRLTLLSRDGQVRRVRIDARSGEPIKGR